MALFKIPSKKKCRKKDHMYNPLPVPVRGLEAKYCRWTFYTAVVVDDHLVVDNSGDVHDLSTKGFFGKLIRKAEPKIFDYCNTEKMADSLVNTENQFEKSTGQSSVVSEVSSLETNRDESSFHVDKELHLECKPPENDISFSNNILHLSFCEGFFLSYSLGCLFVRNDDDLSILQQWQFYCHRKPAFPILYAAYHHFRSKGWVPKDGLRYGADLLLYRKGPPYFHASYLVVVKYVNAQTLKPVQYRSLKQRDFSWESLSGLLRLATTVSKDVMFCHVGIPDSLLNKQDLLPEDINQFEIHETIVSRWVSSKEREKELFDIDCDY